MAGYKKRGRRRGPLAALGHVLLCAVDALCEGIGAAFAALVRVLGRGLLALVKGMWWLLVHLLWLLAAPPVWLFRRLTAKNRRARECLKLDGEEFELYFADVLRDNGFRDVQVTQYCGDQGVDILATRNGVRYAIQCKNYRSPAGNAAVQEAYAGCEYYECDEAAVVCPSGFTIPARELADSPGVQLWGGERLSHMMRVSGRRPRHRKNA